MLPATPTFKLPTLQGIDQIDNSLLPRDTHMGNNGGAYPTDATPPPPPTPSRCSSEAGETAKMPCREGGYLHTPLVPRRM